MGDGVAAVNAGPRLAGGSDGIQHLAGGTIADDVHEYRQPVAFGQADQLIHLRLRVIAMRGRLAILRQHECQIIFNIAVGEHLDVVDAGMRRLMRAPGGDTRDLGAVVGRVHAKGQRNIESQHAVLIERVIRGFDVVIGQRIQDGGDAQ